MSGITEPFLPILLPFARYITSSFCLRSELDSWAGFGRLSSEWRPCWREILALWRLLKTPWVPRSDPSGHLWGNGLCSRLHYSVSPVTLDLTLHLWEPKTVALGPFENLMKAMDLCSRIMCSMHTFNSLFWNNLRQKKKLQELCKDTLWRQEFCHISFIFLVLSLLYMCVHIFFLNQSKLQTLCPFTYKYFSKYTFEFLEIHLWTPRGPWVLD